METVHTVLATESRDEPKASPPPGSRCLRWELGKLISFYGWALRSAPADLEVPLTGLYRTAARYEVSLRKRLHGASLPLLSLSAPREPLLR